MVSRACCKELAGHAAKNRRLIFYFSVFGSMYIKKSLRWPADHWDKGTDNLVNTHERHRKNQFLPKRIWKCLKENKAIKDFIYYHQQIQGKRNCLLVLSHCNIQISNFVSKQQNLSHTKKQYSIFHSKDKRWIDRTYPWGELDIVLTRQKSFSELS